MTLVAVTPGQSEGLLIPRDPAACRDRGNRAANPESTDNGEAFAIRYDKLATVYRSAAVIR